MARLISFWPTNLNSFRADIKDSNHSGDERTNGPEVETSNTPGAINQKHKVGLCFGLTRHIWEGKNISVTVTGQSYSSDTRGAKAVAAAMAI